MINFRIHPRDDAADLLRRARQTVADLEGVTVYHLHTAGPAPFADADKVGRFRSVSLFTGAPLRAAIDEGRADFVPIFLSDIPGLFLSGQVKLDAALLSLSELISARPLRRPMVEQAFIIRT